MPPHPVRTGPHFCFPAQLARVYMVPSVNGGAGSSSQALKGPPKGRSCPLTKTALLAASSGCTRRNPDSLPININVEP